jgi:lipoyl(octanoyl) transferase
MEWKQKKSLINYNQSLSDMKEVVDKLSKGEADEQIWFLEHYPVYTGGSSSDISELVNSNQFPVIQVGRGGKYTYHGPGQRIVYLMLDLKKRNLCDLKQYVFLLEEIIMKILADIGIQSFRKNEYIGVWVKHGDQDKKIAAIGVRVTKWITYHGLAFNINPDLSHYNGIIPCGIQDFGITSLKELNKEITNSEFDNYFKQNFEKVFTGKII